MTGSFICRINDFVMKAKTCIAHSETLKAVNVHAAPVLLSLVGIRQNTKECEDVGKTNMTL